MLFLVLRRMLRNKWMILCLMTGSIMAASLVSSIPVYTDGILQRMLIKDLENMQIETGSFPGAYTLKLNLIYASEPEDHTRAYRSLNEKFWGNTADEFNLPVMAKSQELEAKNMYMTSKPLNATRATKIYPMIGALYDLENHIKITNGRMYSNEMKDGVIEVIVTSKAFKNLGLYLYKEYVLKSSLEYASQEFKFKVVGVFTVKDPSDPYWNTMLSDYGSWMIMDFQLFNSTFVNNDSPWFYYAKWFYALDYHKITIQNMPNILNEYRSQLEELKDYRSTLEIDMSMIPILEKYLERVSQLKTTLLILFVPILIMLAFYTFMIAQLIIGHDENEIAVLKSRGASGRQIFLSYLIESLIVSAIALLAGPPIGMALCKILGSSNGFLEFVQRSALPVQLNSKAYLYAILVIIFMIITIQIPVVFSSRTTIVMYKQTKSRSGKASIWKKYFLDALLLAISVYGLYRYNQQQNILSATGVEASELQIDPLLFLASTLFILGIGLMFLRIYPLIIRFIYWLGRRFWSPVIYISLVQVGRSRGQEQFMMLFIILTISTGLFSANSARTINKNIEDKIQYNIGADVTIMARWSSNRPIAGSPMGAGGLVGSAAATLDEPLRYFEPDYKKFSTLSGTELATKVLINNEVMAQNYDQSTVNVKLMGIIPDEFAKVAWLRPDLLRPHWYNYINLMCDAPNALLLSSNMKDRLNVEVGDSIYVTLGEESYIEGRIYAFVDYWPAYNPNRIEKGEEVPGLIVANYNYLRDRMGIQPYQIWIKKRTGTTDKQINNDIIKKDLDIVDIQYTNQELIKIKNDPMLQGINGSLTLGFIAAMLISMLGFLIYWIISIKSRVLQFGVLRAIGLSFGKLIGMIACEQLLVSGVAILSGIAIGGLTSDLFIPLFQIVNSSAEQVPPFRIIADIMDYTRIYLVISIMLAVGFIALWRIIARIRIDQAVKLGDD